MSSLLPSRILPATTSLPFVWTARDCASSNPGPKSVTSRPWRAERRIEASVRAQPDHAPTRRARPLRRRRRGRACRRPARATAFARSAPGATSTRAMPSPSNVGSSRPSVRVSHRAEHGHERDLGPPGGDDASVGLDRHVGELLRARADVRRHASVVAERPVEPPVRQVARHRGAARDAVRGRADDHDATAGCDRHGRRALEPPSEAGERRAGVREPGVERPVRVGTAGRRTDRMRRRVARRPPRCRRRPGSPGRTRSRSRPGPSRPCRPDRTSGPAVRPG